MVVSLQAKLFVVQVSCPAAEGEGEEWESVWVREGVDAIESVVSKEWLEVNSEPGELVVGLGEKRVKYGTGGNITGHWNVEQTSLRQKH